ncbi:RNA polymerase sigma factor [Parabacteroides sp. PF5-9]|uniref:RNA polymerase sigma factor n=1 Tax=Parabacteroides sp. PF5-9 TaxID=1742404 RepID=UPI00247398BA|nr:RNA polymerase sigma factor [Parabacteroides sp. PF5-9]
MNGEQFKKLFLPYHPKLYRIAFALVENKDDAEDLLQETYCKLWNKREELTEIRNPEAFAVTIIKNLCLDFLRSPRSQNNNECVEGIAQISNVTPERVLEEKDEVDLISQLIERLPENQRRVLKLRGLSDCSLEEIEEITGFSAVNVRTLLSRARKVIREQYEKIYAV